MNENQNDFWFALPILAVNKKPQQLTITVTNGDDTQFYLLVMSWPSKKTLSLLTNSFEISPTYNYESEKIRVEDD